MDFTLESKLEKIEVNPSTGTQVQQCLKRIILSIGIIVLEREKSILQPSACETGISIITWPSSALMIRI